MAEEIHSVTPEIYDLAFSYRDFGAEADCLEYNWQKASKTDNQSVLDIACGTGQHLLQFCSRGYDCAGLDLDENMLEYAQTMFGENNSLIELYNADMRDFTLPKKYGLAINLLTSANHILTNEDMISHLRSVARVLEPGGIYILEMFHPREYGFDTEYPAKNWEINRDEFQLQCDLIYEREEIDPLHQSQKTTFRVILTEGDKTTVYTNSHLHRVYLYLEFMSLVANAGGFKPIICYGTFNSSVILDNSRRSWRMIPVLLRTDETID